MTNNRKVLVLEGELKTYLGGELDERWNIPLKPAAVPIAMAASACITDMAMARTVGIKSREKSMVNL